MSTKPNLSHLTDLRPRITVIGVGGAGCNAVNNMIAAGLTGVDFVVANTDAQALATSSAEHRLQLGTKLTEGLGAGSKPEIGQAAAEEAFDEIRSQIAGSHMVFIAAGMGGGTGTGAASVIARISREAGILTVGVVTKPFLFEGARRMRIAEAGILELKNHVDTLIVIPNQNLFRVANDKTTFEEAFVLADQVLYSGVACIVDLIVKEGLINLDFADVRTVMGGMGTAMMGTGEAEGERRAITAAEEAITNPLLDDVSLKGAKGLLLSITGGRNLTLFEVDEAASRVREEVDPEANIIVGATFDDTLKDRVRVSIVASGMARQSESLQPPPVRPQTNWRTSRPEAAAAQPPHYEASDTFSQPTHDFAPGQEEADHDVQRRLSEALQPEGHAAKSTPEPLTYGTPPAEAWQGPGGVYVEEVRPHAQPQRSAPPRMTDGLSPSLGANAFSPAPPHEARRPARRFPDINDFPQVGQRDYHAKTGAEKSRAPAAAEPHREPPRRPGLFERLTGRARTSTDSPASDSATSKSNVTYVKNGEPEPRAKEPEAVTDSNQRSASRTQEKPELPVFFSNRRR